MIKSERQVAEKIRKLLIEKGLKLKELAEKSGIHYAHLSHMLSGHNRLRVDHIIKIAEALGVEPWELLAPEGTRVHVANGIIAVAGDSNTVQNVKIGQGTRFESKTEEGRKWERLFKDCQIKLKKCIEERKQLEEQIESLKSQNERLKGQIEILEKLLREKEKTIQFLLTKQK